MRIINVGSTGTITLVEGLVNSVISASGGTIETINNRSVNIGSVTTDVFVTVMTNPTFSGTLVNYASNVASNGQRKTISPSGY